MKKVKRVKKVKKVKKVKRVSQLRVRRKKSCFEKNNFFEFFFQKMIVLSSIAPPPPNNTGEFWASTTSCTYGASYLIKAAEKMLKNHNTKYTLHQSTSLKPTTTSTTTTTTTMECDEHPHSLCDAMREIATSCSSSNSLVVYIITSLHCLRGYSSLNRDQLLCEKRISWRIFCTSDGCKEIGEDLLNEILSDIKPHGGCFFVKPENHIQVSERKRSSISYFFLSRAVSLSMLAE